MMFKKIFEATRFHINTIMCISLHQQKHNICASWMTQMTNYQQRFKCVYITGNSDACLAHVFT